MASAAGAHIEAMERRGTLRRMLESPSLELPIVSGLLRSDRGQAASVTAGRLRWRKTSWPLFKELGFEELGFAARGVSATIGPARAAPAGHGRSRRPEAEPTTDRS